MEVIYMKKMFQKNLMASEDVQSYLGTGRFYEADAEGELKEAAITDGALVEIGGIENHSVYTGIKDVNVRKITVPTDDTVRYGIVDYVGRSEGEINGVLYREGVKTAGLSANAGENVRYRIPKVEDTFYLATGNFVGTPGTGKYAIPTKNSVDWTISTSPATSGLCVLIETSKNLTEGAVDTDTLWFCTVISA